MPQRFFTLDDLRRYGVTRGDLRRPTVVSLAAWQLQESVATLLRPLLERTGFDLNEVIHVHESPDPPGFVFTQ